MKIDITPTIEIAEGFDRVQLESQGLDAIYMIRTHDDKQFSVKWSNLKMQEFKPNTTVSEMIKSWEEGFERRVKVIKKAIKTKIHPTWTVTEKVEGNDWEKIEVPYKLSKDELQNFKDELPKAIGKIGKLKFIKIV